MTTTTMHKAGVRDWAAKKVLLKGLYDVLGDKDLIESVVEPYIKEAYQKRLFIDKTCVAWQKWSRSRPTGERSRQFWDFLIAFFRLEVRAPQLWSSSIVEFAEFFRDESEIAIAVAALATDERLAIDEDTRHELLGRFPHGGVVESASGPLVCGDTDGFSLWCNARTTFEDPQAAIRSGRAPLASSFYTVPRAATAWTALVDAAGYHMYLDCLLTLKDLVESECWKAALCDGRFTTAVSLAGGGSPQKDWVLASSLIDPRGGPLEYLIVDISRYMIQETASVLCRRLLKHKLAEKIRLHMVNEDVLKLDVRFPRPAHWGSAVWALLGGTIGNLSELDFLRSINGPSRVGDLLVIGVDTLDAESPDQLDERLDTQYRCTELDALLLTHVGDGGGADTSDGPVVTVSVTTERDSPSDVPQSRTAIFKDGRGNPLATSTRYVLDEFLAFVSRFGWDHVWTQAGPESSTFRQLLLRRTH